MKAGQAGSRQGLPWTSRRPSDIYVMLVCWPESVGYLMMLHLDDASKCLVLYSSCIFRWLWPSHIVLLWFH